jgi:hypothetical protein
LLAWILRASFGPSNRRGTWQSGQVARTPDAFCEVRALAVLLVHGVDFISWHEMQKSIVLVASRTVLNPPQNTTPITAPAIEQA